MTVIEREGELEFVFPSEAKPQKLDKSGTCIPEGMCLVDFYIQGGISSYLVEVKDFSCSTALEDNVRNDAKRIVTNEFISQKLVPKARDSYTYLHLMKEDSRPFKYIVLLCVERLHVDKLLLLNFKERLFQRIRKEADIPWKREYISECIVCTLESWDKFFPNISLRRVYRDSIHLTLPPRAG